MYHVSRLQDLDYRALRGVRLRALEHRVMTVRIECLSERVDLLHAVTSQRRQQISFGRLDARKHPLDRRAVGSIRCCAVDRTAEIVERVQQILRNARGCEFHCLIALLPHLPAYVLLFGQRAHQLVLGFGKFGRSDA